MIPTTNSFEDVFKNNLSDYSVNGSSRLDSVIYLESTLLEKQLLMVDSEDLLRFEVHIIMAHIAKPSLDVMPFVVLSQSFYCYGIPRPLLRQNCFPLMHGRKLHILDLL